MITIPKKVHIIGIGGTAMSAIAGLYREAGCEVRGSDSGKPYPPVSQLLGRLSIPVMYPYSKENLAWAPDLVIIGNVIRRTNPEAIAVLESGLPYISMPQALREHFLTNRFPLVVAGTHGKTTTSSLVAYLLYGQGFDPSFLIGGIPRDFESNFRLGKGEFFVVEGDEYDTAFFDKRPKFLHYCPKAAIVNNIEYDHADIFANLDNVVAAFASFVETLPQNAPLVVPANDRIVGSIVTGGRRAVTFGIEEGDYCVRDLKWVEGEAQFELLRHGKSMGMFKVRLIGEHNIKNVAAAFALCHEIGAVTKDLSSVLAGFQGVHKRQEVKGIVGGVTVIDDFAHHPTAVRETIMALRLAYPTSRLIVLFEPESNTSRRKVFQNEYADAFAYADCVLFYKPLEKPDNLPPEERIDMNRLCADIISHGTPAKMIPDIDELAAEAITLAKDGDVIVGMSGRDFLGVHTKILQLLECKAFKAAS